MAGLTEFYCRSNETSHASQFKWLDNTFKDKKFYNKKFNNKNFSQKNGFTNSSLTELILANIEQINQNKIDASQILSRHMSRIYVGTQRITKYGTS